MQQSHTNPNHKYLVETNPAFGVKSFINSDYLLSKLGYEPDEAQRRLGDGMYEQRLIQQAITARTGQYFVNGMTDGDQLYQYLMDNAIASKEALNLTVGVGLTAEQVAALTHDIVWLEEREVQGQKVLVPIVYMAQANNRLAPTGSLIQGYDLSLIAGNNLTNTGTLQADQSIQARAKNVINGGLFETNQLAINATDNIINTNGGIIKGQQVDLTAEEGTVINERAVTTHQTLSTNIYKQKDFVSEASIIESTGNLTINAGQNIINQGSYLKAQNADLNAKGNIAITSTEQTEARIISGKKSSQSQSITQIGSQLDIANDLTIHAGENIQVTASTVTAGNTANLTAGKDITINAAANEVHQNSKSKTLTSQYDDVKQQQSLITANNLTISANNNLNLGATTITANEAYLYAGNQIKAEAQQDNNYYLYDKKTGGSGSFSQKATKRDEVTDIKNVSATFNISNNLTLKSGGDQSYQAITINTPKGESAGTVTFDSGGNIVFESVKDYHQESHEKSKSDWSWNSAKGKGQTDETFKQTTIIGDAKVVIKAVDGLKLDIKDNGITPQTVDQAIDAMVKADPNLMWIKEAQKNGDIDYNAVKEIHDKWKYESSSLGVGASLVIAIAAAAIAGPAAAGAVAGAGAGGTAAAVSGAVAGSMAGTSAVSLVNNKGNLGNTLKDTFSGDNLKNYAIAGITAGITAGVIDAKLGGKSDAINKTTSGFDLNDWSLTAGKSNGLQGFIVHQGAQAVNEATVGTIINGGSLGDNLVNALKNHAYESGQAIGFNQVGNWGQANGYESGSPGKIIGHAVVGGTANVIMGGKFTDGAAAAGINEAVSGIIFDGIGIADKNGNNGNNTSYQQSVSNIIGVIAGGITNAKDQDLEQLGNIAKNGTAYNEQIHPKDVAIIEDAAQKMADKEGISKEEAEKKLAEAYMYYTDATWNQVINNYYLVTDLGYTPDATTMQYLGEAFASSAGRFEAPKAITDQDIINYPAPANGTNYSNSELASLNMNDAQSSHNYTAQETIELLQNFKTNNSARYNDSTINQQYLSQKGWLQSTVSGGLSYLTNPNYQSDIPNSSVIDKQVDFYNKNLDYSDKSLLNYLNYGLGYGSGLGGSIQGTVEGSVWTVLNPNEAGNGLLAGIASGGLAEQGYESINNTAAQQVLKNLQNDWAGVGYLSGKFQGDVAQALAPGLIEAGKLGVASRGKTLLGAGKESNIDTNYIRDNIANSQKGNQSSSNVPNTNTQSKDLVIRQGSINVEKGATPNANELQAGKSFSDLGYDVTHRVESKIPNERTSDLMVTGIGKVDVYTPDTTTNVNGILRSIEKKNTQATAIIIQTDLSSKRIFEIVNRYFGKTNGKNIETLFFQNSKGNIIRFDRTKK